MRPSRLLPKILLFSGFLALFLLLKFQTEVKNFTSLQIEKIKTHRDNFFARANPEIAKRERTPFTTVKESQLEVGVGEPFSNFTTEEWDEFWEIVYGLYPRGEPEKPGLPNRMRQLSQEEMISELSSRYPQPFARFSQRQWEIFFGIILKDE